MKRWLLVLPLALSACLTAPLETLEVEGGPSGGDFRLRFEGNRTYPWRTLRRAIALDLEDYTASGFQLAYVDDAAFGIEQVYREAGFPDVEVEYLVGEGDDPHGVRFVVEEGPRTRIERVDVEGLGEASELSAAEVATFFERSRGSFLGNGTTVFVQARVDGAPERLRNEYVARGYLDARIEEPRLLWNADRTEVVIDVTVQEGRRYQLTELTAGPVAAAVPGWQELAARLGPQDGTPRPFLPRVEADLRGALTSLARDAAYPDAFVHVTIEVDPTSAEVKVAVELETGPRVTVTDVSFEGNQETREAFLRTRIEIEGGDPAQAQAIRDSLQRLYRTGLFAHVDARLVGTGDTRALVFELEERDSLEFFVEPGWGSYELARIRVGVRERNLLGTGRRLRVEALAAIRALRALLRVSDPFTFGEELIGDLVLQHEERQQPSFDSLKTSVGFFLTHEWDLVGRTATSLGYQFRDTRSRQVEVQAAALDASEGSGEFGSEVDLSALKLSHIIEQRDSPLIPRAGYQARVSVEYGDSNLGSDLDYTRVDLTWSHSQSFGRRDVLALAYRGGVIAPRNGQEVPIQERYFNGGENTVRSFRQDDLGPKDANGEPVGGEAWNVLNIEWRHDLGDTGFQSALFGDAGNVLPDAGDFGELRDLDSAIGVGLRYVLPVGPLRLDAAFNPDHRTGEDEWIVHFSVGMPF